MALTPDFGVSGFTTEESAGRWLAAYLCQIAIASGDKQAELMRAVLIASTPSGKQ